MTAIVKKVREKLPDTKVLLVAIFPRNENYSAQRGKILQVNQVLRKLADQQNIFWIDFGHRFVNEDGLIPTSLMPDYLHLTQRGYEIWAESIERRLASIIGDTPVRPLASSSANLTGEWTSAVRGEDGQTFDSRLLLQANDGTVTGKVSRGDDRWLQIENGKVQGNQVSWIVKRDRPDGSIMTYRMTGKIDGAKITGTATTQVNGQQQTVEWSAERK